MSNINIELPKIWKQIIDTDKKMILIPTGRVSGKTKNSVIFSTALMLQNPYKDIVITRSSYGSMRDSLYAEFVSQLEEMPEEISNQFTAVKAPSLRIDRENDSGSIYFIGSGGSNKDRTKGFKPRHELIAVIVEETQEFKDKESLDQFLASVRRRFGENCILIVLGNPPAIEAHWFNLFVKAKENDKDWLVARMTWQDITPFLNDTDIKEILKCKFLEPEYYDWLYGGIATGGRGLCYPMFRKDLHLIDYNYRSNSKLLEDFRIVGVIIGGDSAVNNDATALVPRFIMSNGQSVAGKIFYHNPQVDGVKGSFPLVENQVSRWFSDLIRENNLDNPYNYMASIPIIFVVDSAATEFIQALRYYFSNRAEVYPIKKGTIIQMVDVVQSALGKNVVAIYDYGGYYNYTQNKWITCENILATQYRSLIWDDKQTGYNPAIPNDVIDADTYGIYFYYRQVENIIWLRDVVGQRKDYYPIKN